MPVIYELRCVDCNEDLGFSLVLDKDNDLLVSVDPCEECMDKAREEGRQEVCEEQE